MAFNSVISYGFILPLLQAFEKKTRVLMSFCLLDNSVMRKDEILQRATCEFCDTFSNSLGPAFRRSPFLTHAAGTFCTW